MMLVVGVVVIVLCGVVGVVLGLAQYALSVGRQSRKKGGGMKRQCAMGICIAVLLTARAGWAASLGIPLDGFLATFETFVVGLGLVIGMAGLVGYVGSLVRCESAL